MKLLVKKKNGKVHIREKSEECLETLSEVHPNKVATWATFGGASHKAAEDGATMEGIIQAVIDEMRGTSFKADKQRVPVTEAEYKELLIQCAKKGVAQSKLDALVVIVHDKKLTVEEIVEQILIERQ